MNSTNIPYLVGVENIDEKQTSTTVSDVKEINTDNEAWV